MPVNNTLLLNLAGSDGYSFTDANSSVLVLTTGSNSSTVYNSTSAYLTHSNTVLSKYGQIILLNTVDNLWEYTSNLGSLQSGTEDDLGYGVITTYTILTKLSIANIGGSYFNYGYVSALFE